MKVIDLLSNDVIPQSEISLFSVDLIGAVDADNWHEFDAVILELSATPGIGCAAILQSEGYNIFALVDDGRKEGACFFPVEIIED